MIRFTPPSGGHTDVRRTIADFDFPTDTLAKMKKANLIVCSDEAVRQQLPLGNHYHEGGFEELFFVIGPPDVDVFKLHWRFYGERPCCGFLRNGDSVHISSRTTHAFVPLAPGATLVTLATGPFDKERTHTDKIV